MTEARLSLGRCGEEAAALYLAEQGYRIVARNLRTPVGEIDIIAQQGKLLIFIEVKTRRSLAFGSPQEAVGPRKQRQIIRTAQWYLSDARHRGLQPRFDVIAILYLPTGPQIEHIVNAFGL
ncbi:MAG: YraN family protein [Desulfuromonadales bacterium]|nr:YraN family protein [Desulfuromonadales bacterium]